MTYIREERPLFYDGSGRHPRYHCYDPEFTGKWYLWIMILMAVIYISIALPIYYIARMIRWIYAKVF